MHICINTFTKRINNKLLLHVIVDSSHPIITISLDLVGNINNYIGNYNARNP